MDNQEEKSFAELMAENPPEKDWLRPGEKVHSQIVKITPEWLFIDLGSKSEGYLDRNEFVDPDGNLTVSVGDSIDVYFLSLKNGEKLFTRKIGRGEAAKAHLEEAWRNGIPLEGKISKETKGGLEVLLAGNIRAFCPFSQSGISRTEKAADYIGKTLPFKIIEFSEGGRKIILSHRIILDEEKAKVKEELKETLKEGMTVTGRVISLHNFGAFLDIGGIHGLLPVSELGWSRNEGLNDLLSVGASLPVTILKLDWDGDRITLSRKATLTDPWVDLEQGLAPGKNFHGHVTSLTSFGAFVALENGIEGMIHISKLGKGKRIKHPSEVLAKGQAVDVIIESIDNEKKRISLSLSGDEIKDQRENEADQTLLTQYLDSSKTSTFGSLGDAFKSKKTSK